MAIADRNNKRKVYGGGQNADGQGAKPCTVCGCRHFERMPGESVTRCRNCGQIR